MQQVPSMSTATRLYIIGDQPRGQMTFYRNSVPGYEGQVARI